MAGRTTNKHIRVYADGVNLSGYTREIGPLAWEFDTPDLTTFSDAIKGALPNHCNIGLGTQNGVLDNTATSGLHAILSAAGSKHIVTVAIGDRAAPAAGVPCFVAQPNQLAYQPSDDGGAMVASLPWGMHASDGATLLYPKPWGVIVDPGLVAKTAANSGTGVDDFGAATALGGYFVYHILAGNGTATVSLDDSADNSSFTALSGATSGSINCATVQAGIVALGRTATVRRYLRFQIAMGTATSVTALWAFVRMTW